MIKNILFDLDGTLLPMDMEKFTQGYFKRLVMKAAPHGYEPEKAYEKRLGRHRGNGEE